MDPFTGMLYTMIIFPLNIIMTVLLAINTLPSTFVVANSII